MHADRLGVAVGLNLLGLAGERAAVAPSAVTRRATERRSYGGPCSCQGRVISPCHRVSVRRRVWRRSAVRIASCQNLREGSYVASPSFLRFGGFTNALFTAGLIGAGALVSAMV